MTTSLSPLQQARLNEQLFSAVETLRLDKVEAALIAGASPCIFGSFAAQKISPLELSISYGPSGEEVSKCLTQALLEWDDVPKARHFLSMGVKTALGIDEPEVVRELLQVGNKMGFRQEVYYQLLRQLGFKGAEKSAPVFMQCNFIDKAFLFNAPRWQSDSETGFRCPLELALEKGHYPCAKVLAEQGAPLPMIKAKGGHVISATLQAWTSGMRYATNPVQKEAARQALDALARRGALEVPTGQKFYPLLGAASQRPIDLLSAALLVHSGANPEGPIGPSVPNTLTRLLKEKGLTEEFTYLLSWAQLRSLEDEVALPAPTSRSRL